MSKSSMNHVYRVVWNGAKGIWQVVAEIGRRAGKCHSQTRRRKLAVAIFAAGVAPLALAADLPTGGVVVAGNGNISQSGNTMTIVQGSNKLAIDWQSFSIGQGQRVNFIQPSSSSVALNRVLGSDVSQIQGNLTANGQVFLINPNGVLFSPTAQVNVGGLVASTLSLGNDDFLAGNYRFSGGSSNAIINQGNITALGENGKGGTIALIAAKISNTGTLTANAGNVLLGAGSQVMLDMGGPVKLQVEQAVLNALIENGGVIKADGGLVYLTAKAANALATTVINNTGLIEARTLATGETGKIYLLGDMENDHISVGGTLDASAPQGGNGGFVETSAAKVELQDGLHVTTMAVYGNTGNWLIDPATYTVAASGGDETGASLAARLGSTNIILQADNEIIIDDAVNWSANKLTLFSGHNININANLAATGTASLAFAYGQATADGAGSTYTVANGAKITIPDAANFTWQKGSAGAVNNLVFNNGLMRFGNGGQAALTSDGLLQQPFYFNNGTSFSGCATGTWCQLTFGNYPLDMAVGSGGTGTNSWNYNGQVLSTGDATYSAALSNRAVDISGYREGIGTIIALGTLTFNSTGAQVRVANAYTLDSSTQFVKTTTTLTNLSSTQSVNNLRLWMGTRDDFVGGSDATYKLKGNLDASGFVLSTDPTQQAKAIQVVNSTSANGTAIMLYSTSAGADTVSDHCCSFTNVVNKNPRSSVVNTGSTDGSYALFIRMADLAPGASDSMVSYYAAAPVSEIGRVATGIGQATTTPTPAPVTPTPAPSVPPNAAITQAQSTATHVVQLSQSVPVLPELGAGQRNTVGYVGSSGGLTFVSLSQEGGSRGETSTSGGQTGGQTGGQASSANPVLTTNAGVDAAGFMRLFVIGGGVHLPELSDNAQGPITR